MTIFKNTKTKQNHTFELFSTKLTNFSFFVTLRKDDIRDKKPNINRIKLKIKGKITKLISLPKKFIN